MISSLIFLMIRRFRRLHPLKFQLFVSKAIFVAKILLLILISCTIVMAARAQEKNLAYTVIRNGNEIGCITIKEIKNGTRVTYRLESEIKTTFIFTFKVSATEEAVYENGVLLNSFIYRKVNGSEKANKSIRYSSNNYIVSNKGSEKWLNNYPIRYNMVCLYTQEPVYISQIFSDNFQQFIPIKKTGRHQYKIIFPDGNSNEYFYQKGICIRIKMNSSLYNAEIEKKG
ncbi:MAG: DUF6134 family protein [Chitinophagaceae bacterium]